MRMRRLRRKGAARYAKPDGAPHVLRECSVFSNLLQWKLDERLQRGARKKAREIINGNFNFLGQSLNFPASIDWRMKNHPEFDALWCFHLHYHEYLLDLAAIQIPRSCAAKDHAHFADAWRIVDDWIQWNQPHDGNVFKDAWHPFCISRRLPVWMLLWAAGQPEESNQATILESMVSQTNFLADHLEFDLGGNHLLENLRALGMASCFFSGSNAERWMAIVKQLLPYELDQQITRHGEHFERSPMYHGFMLEAVLDLRDVMQVIVPFDVHPVRWPSRHQSMVRHFDMPTNDRRLARHIVDKHCVRLGPKKNRQFLPFVLVEASPDTQLEIETTYRIVPSGRLVIHCEPAYYGNIDASDRPHSHRRHYQRLPVVPLMILRW